MLDLDLADATALIQAMQARRVSALELLEAAVERKAETHAALNAVVAENLPAARAAARAVDQMRSSGEGEAIGLLAGLPMTIKDTFDVEGLPASSGLAAYLNRPAQDAVVVAKVRSEGAVVWGKTNVPVLASDWQSFNPLYGVTNNPHDPERTPGGSSGGAAAALAAGVTALEIGSDIGGSLRVPASFCGVYAHKPTYGLVSQRGHVPPAPGAAAERDLNVVGPMARSARDLRLLLSVLAGGPISARAPPTQLEGLKVAAWIEDPKFVLDAEVKTVVDTFLSDLGALGARVEPIASPVAGGELLEVYLRLLYPLAMEDAGEGARRRLERLRLPARLFGGRSRWAELVRAGTLSHHDWLLADERRARFKRTLRELFKRIDVLIAPIAPVVAFPHVRGPMRKRVLHCSDGRKIPYDTMLNWIALATACGLPATAIPAGFSPSGLPVGVQIIGPIGGDAKTLGVAQAIEEALGGYRAPALLRPPA